LKGADQDAMGLRPEIIALRLRIDRLVALLRLMTLLLKLSGFSFARVRLSDGAAKARMLHAIDRSRSHFTLRAVLRFLILLNKANARRSNSGPVGRPVAIPERLGPKVTIEPRTAA
jgi:hypothetical protein